MAVDRPDVRGSILSATTTRPADAPASSPGTSAATPSGAGAIDPASAGTTAAPPGSAAGPAQAAPASAPRVKDGFDLMAKPPLLGSEGVPGAPVSSSPAGAPLKVVEVSQAKVQQLRAEFERRSDTLDRRTRRAVDSLFARASQPLPPGVTVARSQEGAAERLTLTRRDPEGRIVSIESGEREGERAEYQRTDWMGERATRRTLQTGERASERITRNESWPATPSAQPETPSTGELHAQAQQGQAVEIHEERYGRETVGNDEHFAHTEHEASAAGEHTTTERYSRPDSMADLPAHVEKELEPGKPLDVVERTTSERTYEGGKASEPKESKQTAASQGNRRVTQVEEGGERSFVVEKQEGEKYSAQTYKPGSTQPAETVERVAKGSTVLETVERPAEKGKDPKPTSARVETEYEHSGVVRRRDVRSTDSDGARTHQVYTSSEQKTERGLETHERVDVTLELKSPEGSPEPATYQQRREVHGLVGPNGWQLLGTREEMRGPNGETACATFDEHGARLTVNGKEVPLGDPAASPLPTSGRELATLVLSGAAGLVRKYVEATQPRAPGQQPAAETAADGQTPSPLPAPAAGEFGHTIEGGVQLPAAEQLEPQGAHGQQQLPAQPGTSTPEAQLPLATQAGQISSPPGDFKPGAQQQPASKPFEPQGAQGQQRPPQPGTSTPDPRVPFANQGGQTSAPIGDFKPGAQQQPASKPFEPQGAQGQQRPPQQGTSTPDPRVPFATQDGRPSAPLGDLKPGAQQQPASKPFEPQGAQGQKRPPQQGTSTPDPRVPLATQTGQISSPLGGVQPGAQQQPASQAFEPQGTRGQQQPSQPGTSTPDPRVPLATQDGRTGAPSGDFKPGAQQQPASKPFEPQGAQGQQRPPQQGTSTPDPRVPLANQTGQSSSPSGDFKPGAQQQPASKPFEPQGAQGQQRPPQPGTSTPDPRVPFANQTGQISSPIGDFKPGTQQQPASKPFEPQGAQGQQRPSLPGTSTPDPRVPLANQTGQVSSPIGDFKPGVQQQPASKSFEPQGAQGQQRPSQPGTATSDPRVPLATQTGQISSPIGDFKPGAQPQPPSKPFEPQGAQGQQRPSQPGTSTPDPRVPLATQDGRTSVPLGDFKPGVQQPQQPASKPFEPQGTRGQQLPSQQGTSTPDPQLPLTTQAGQTSTPIGDFKPGVQQPQQPAARDSRTGAPLTESKPGAQRPTTGRADPRTPPSGAQRGSTPQGTAVPASARDARTPSLGEPKPTASPQPRGEARPQQARDQQAPVPLGESPAEPTIQAQADSGTPRSAPTSARSPDRAPAAETPARRGDSPQPQSAGRTTPANDARAPRAPSDRSQPTAARTPAPEGKRSQPGTTPSPSSARSQPTASGARRDISSDARAPDTQSQVAPEVSPDVEPARTDDPREAPEAARTAEPADSGATEFDITLPGHRFTGSISPRASAAAPDRGNDRQTPHGAPPRETTRAEEPPRSATPARALSESGRSSVFNATPSGQPSPSNVSNTPSWEQRLAEVLKDPEIQSALKNLDTLREPNTPVGRLLQSASSLLAAVQQANEAQGLKIMAERSAPALMPSISPRARREEPRGGRLGKYQLLKRIGAGGMGEVFLARSGGARGFQKDLVIKRILPHLAEDEHFLSLFLDEARIAARLNHPNIAQIFELGEAGGSFYLAMEHVNGPDLKRIVRQSKKSNKPVPLGTACRIVADVAAGLEYAHKARDAQGQSLGIIHRDVSPHNILVSFEGAVKLIDFGVAKALDRSTQTGVGAFRGKIPYTAPEQLDGKPADARSDVFSLGVVFWELLTSRRLFEAPNEPATILLISDCKVPAPSTVNRAVPRSLDEIALKALAKDPARRYADAASFRRALEGFAVSSRLPASSVDVETYLHDLFATEQALAGDSRSTPALGERSPSGNTKATPAPARTREVTPAYAQARMEATPGPDLDRTLIDGSLPAEDEREEPQRPTLPAIRIVNPR